MIKTKFRQLLANLEFEVGGEPSEWYAARQGLIDYVENLEGALKAFLEQSAPLREEYADIDDAAKRAEEVLNEYS